MTDCRIQTGLRVPEPMYDELSRLSKETGASINAVALMLLSIGLRVIRLDQPEAAHALLRNPKGAS